jgi:hypothetical protein
MVVIWLSRIPVPDQISLYPKRPIVVGRSYTLMNHLQHPLNITVKKYQSFEAAATLEPFQARLISVFRVGAYLALVLACEESRYSHEAPDGGGLAVKESWPCFVRKGMFASGSMKCKRAAFGGLVMIDGRSGWRIWM